MRLRKVGTFAYKGSHGLYVEAVDLPSTAARYAAIEYGQMDEAESLGLDPEGWLHTRIDDCHA